VARVTLTFDGLAEVSLARDLLRKWWGLDLGFSEPDGGGYVRASHATCESIRGVATAACAAALKDLATELAKSKDRNAVARTCHRKIIIAAPVPVRSHCRSRVRDGRLRGRRRDVRSHIVRTIGATSDEARAMAGLA
jgi:hypothetical protein